MTTTNETEEHEARRLRDLVYGKPISDNEWNYCRDNWIKDLPWLRVEARKILQ